MGGSLWRGWVLVDHSPAAADADGVLVPEPVFVLERRPGDVEDHLRFLVEFDGYCELFLSRLSIAYLRSPRYAIGCFAVPSHRQGEIFLQFLMVEFADHMLAVFELAPWFDHVFRREVFRVH